MNVTHLGITYRVSTEGSINDLIAILFPAPPRPRRLRVLSDEDTANRRPGADLEDQIEAEAR
jgi:hypothetical protein